MYGQVFHFVLCIGAKFSVKEMIMKTILLGACLIALCLSCTNDSSIASNSTQTVAYSQVSMNCMDRVSSGGTLEVIVNTKTVFDSLVYARYQKPLDDYWDKYYDSTLYHVKQNNPGLSDSEYALLVRNVFYSAMPFKGTDTCTDSDVDFDHFTLLGASVTASGCRSPEYRVDVSRNDAQKKLFCNVEITQHGSCEMGFWRAIWIVVPKLPSDFLVVFEKNLIMDSL